MLWRRAGEGGVGSEGCECKRCEGMKRVRIFGFEFTLWVTAGANDGDGKKC